MTDHLYTEKTSILALLRLSNRLRFLLTDEYGIRVEEIVSVFVDRENKKLDIQLSDRLLRFKAKGVRNVLVPNEKTAGLRFTLDPALAMGIYEIIGEFG